MAEEEENPGIGCPTVSEAVLGPLRIDQLHRTEGGYVKWHVLSLGRS
jgi:hypothetical protein